MGQLIILLLYLPHGRAAIEFPAEFSSFPIPFSRRERYTRAEMAENPSERTSQKENNGSR